MTENITVNKDFNFEGIFPQCRKEYELVNKNRIRLWYDLSSMCSDFRNYIQPTGYKTLFEVPDLCEYLGVYLDYIKDKSANDKKRSCLYFFYKLKDLVNTYKGKCYTTKECYEKMRKKYVTVYGAQKNYLAVISDTCKDEVTEINNIDDKTFHILKYLDDLHNKFENLKITKHKTDKDSCAFNKKCLDIYDKLSEINKKSQNEGLKSELEKFKSAYDKYVKSNPPCENQAKILYLSTGTNTGIAVSTFVIIINLFVLYKVEKKLNLLYLSYTYTVFGKILKSPVKKVKKSLNKNKNDNFNLIYSSENEQNVLNYNNYRIAYSSAD
ncbi:variable surface protein [Plasmodium gonderi]|uniref:Variable surface protein n=1 Tax=Plasmodium gonderi TaxID=77519 RepID=A0A1Y1JQV0_PLAGO|nr:variable surface protein [Plasmodium gonderi]GAW84610.1 variable surface protein [Plasmodium gonderi]